jgi:hypothetical protein
MSSMPLGRSFDPAAVVNALAPRNFINLYHMFLTNSVIASFPKTGNTWLGAMLRYLIVHRYGLPESRMPKLFVSDHRPAEVLRIPRGIPRIYQRHFIITAEGAEPHLGRMREELAPF